MNDSSEIPSLSDILRGDHPEDILSENIINQDFKRTGRGVKKTKKDRAVISSEFNEERDGQAWLDAKANGSLLKNATPPSFTILQEKPEHLFLVHLFASGWNVRQIFQHLGGLVDESGRCLPGTGQYSYPHLCNIRKQTWFQERLIEYFRELGKDKIEATLAIEVAPSLSTMVEIRDNPKVSPNVRLSAATTIMERALGKPTQHVKVENTKTVGDYEEELKNLREEEERLNSELRSLKIK